MKNETSPVRTVLGPLAVIDAAWRWLRRMSTALLLLFILAIATTIGTFIPQEPVIGSTVQQWRSGVAGPGQTVSDVLDVFGLYDVFGSWWFVTITMLLMVSLGGCLVPRWRTFWRTAKTPPAAGRNLTRLTNYHRIAVDSPLAKDKFEAAVAELLPRYRRVSFSKGEVHQIAAEQGLWREGGSLIFHTSFFVILAGVIAGAGFSFTGQINIVEGEAFADTPLGYVQTTPGRLWRAESHRGHLTHIDEFKVTYLDGDNRFVPDEFRTTVTFTDPATGQTSTQDIRVNHPGRFNGLNYYQRAFGFAPRVILRSGVDGTVVFDQRMVLRPGSGGVWTGRGKVSLGSDHPVNPLPQIGVEVTFLPDASLEQNGFRMNSPEPNSPRMVVALYSGDDLGLDRTVPVSSLQWPASAMVDQAMIVPEQETALVGGLFTVEFAELSYWTGLQVAHQPFRWVLLIGVGLLLAGLVPSLYAYRRRVWVELHPDGVVLAGVALHRKERFVEEFEALAGRVNVLVTTPKEHV